MPSDTFAIQRDAAFYVARLASERAIALLRQKLFGTAGIVALVGPPGIGKSVIAERAARGVERKVTCVRLRLEGRSCEELCAAVIAELEASGAASEPVTGDQTESPAARMRQWVRSEAEAVRSGPERTLVEAAARLRRAGRPLALFIDDADAIADRTVARLYELATGSRSIAICLVLADEREFEGLPKKLLVIRYDEPMSLGETTAYVNARLMRGDSPTELRQLLDDAMIRRVHAYSGGIPRRVHAEIALLMSDARARETARQDASLYPVVVGETPTLFEADASYELPSRARLRWLTLGAAAGSALSALLALAVVQFAPDLIRLRPTAAPELRADPAPVTSDFEPGAPAVVTGSAELDREPSATPPAETTENLATAPRRRTPREEDPGERSSRLQAVARSDAERAAAPRKSVGTEVASTTPTAPAVAKPPTPKPRAAAPAPAPTPVPVPTQAASAAVPTAAPVPETLAQPADKPQLFYADVNAVPRALITIDGVEIGQTPLGGLPLEEGIHQFRAVMTDGRVLERAILISKDRQRILFE